MSFSIDHSKMLSEICNNQDVRVYSFPEDTDVPELKMTTDVPITLREVSICIDNL